MAESATPATGTEQAAPTEAALESILEQALGDKPTKEATPETPKEQESAPELTDEVTPDDIPDEVEAEPQEPSADAFEIVHNGTQHKLTREDTIRYAQQGFDYTQKTMQLAEQAKQVQARLERVAEIEQMAPALTQDMALITALDAQLKPYANVDWVALASNPETMFEYPKHRAQYDELLKQRQGAVNQYFQKREFVEGQKRELSQQQLRQEFQQLTERIPAWKDAAKFETEKAGLRNYLLSQGADQTRVDGLNSALEVEIAYKAMKYDQLLKAKGEKVKQLRTAPPVVKPGAAASQTQSGKTDFAKVRQEIRAQGKKGNHRAQEELATQLFNRAFK